MPHHFLYLKNAYHILITKPSLPHLYLYYIQKLARKLLAISQNYRASEQPTWLRSAPKGAKIYPSELVGLIDVPVKHSRCVRSLAWQNGEQKERREKERP